MYLHKQDKRLLLNNIMTIFKLNEQKAYYIVELLQKAIFENDKEILYHLKYRVHFQNSPTYTEKILHSALKTYTFVMSHKRYEAYKEQFLQFYLAFFDIIFIQRCRYAKRIEKRSNTTQQILQHLSTQLNETLHRQELMIANISHEMRTSLNSISGYLTLLKERKTFQGEEESFLLKAHHASETLNHLVSDILDVTKINSGQLEIKEEYFWVDELIIKCIDNFSLDLEKKSNITLTTEIDFFPNKVYADQQHIHEIISNLLGNAIKYTDKGNIHLVVKKTTLDNHNVQLHITISDTGIGMTTEQLKYIFDPYSRFETDRKGIGLGLHISSKLAQKLHAKLTVKSQYHEGSTFDFIVPCKTDVASLLNLEGRCIYCFNSTHNRNQSEDRTKHLEEIGADIHIFCKEKEFINFLLTDSKNTPDIISINTDAKYYAKFDALINYLKTLEQYKNTTFIAEYTKGNVSLKYFDKIFDYFAPLTFFVPKSPISPQQKIYQKNKHINLLVVDDIQTNLEIFSKFVSKRYPNVTIDMANGGYEAIGMYKTKSYDIVFLDIKMPGLSGIEVIKKLKEIRTLPPTYALTADVYKTTYEQILEVGFTQLLEKPLQLDILYKTIEGVINVQHT